MATRKSNFLGWVFAIMLTLAFTGYGFACLVISDPEGICLRYYGASHEALGLFIIMISVMMMKGFLDIIYSKSYIEDIWK